MKPFKDTKIAAFLKETAPNVLSAVVDVAGNYFPPVKILSALIKGDSTLTSEQKIEAENKVAEYELSELKEYLQDVQDARSLQKSAIASSDWLTRNYIYLLASVVILSAIFFGIALCYVSIPEGNKRLVEMFADVFLFAGAMMVLSFFFGSSKGSKDNAEVIRKIAQSD